MLTEKRKADPKTGFCTRSKTKLLLQISFNDVEKGREEFPEQLQRFIFIEINRFLLRSQLPKLLLLWRSKHRLRYPKV